MPHPIPPPNVRRPISARPPRRAFLRGLAALGAVLTGCGGESHSSKDPGGPGRSAALRNMTGTDVRIGLKVNGSALMASDAEVAAEAWSQMLADDSSATLSPPRRFALALWRLVMRNRTHFDPLTSWNWVHSPVLFMNSLGFGYCDDVASVFAKVARQAGHAARVWSLTGHVVPEIMVDGRWEMYDPDLGVFYLDAQGRVCGVEELAANPRLITEPLLASLPGWAYELAATDGGTPDDEVRYSALVADIYSSTADNSVSPGYDEIPYAPPSGRPLLVPAASTVTIGLRSEASVVTYYGEMLPRQGCLRIDLPPGPDRVLDLPLIPLRIAGAGGVRVDGEAYLVGSEALRQRLTAFEQPVNRIELQSSTSPATIEYLLSDSRFRLQSLQSVEPTQADPGAFAVTYSDLPPD